MFACLPPVDVDTLRLFLRQFCLTSVDIVLEGLFIKIEDLYQPFNALSYLMVARYAVQATVVNEFTCCFSELRDRNTLYFKLR